MSTRQVITKYWRPDIALLIGASVLSAAILGINAITLGNLREETVRSVKANMQSQAVALAEEGDRSFKVLDMALSAIADTISSIDEPVERRFAGHDTHEWLRAKAAGMPHVDGISLIDANGKLVNLTRYWPIPAADFSDHDYFRALKGNPPSKIFVSEPIQSSETKAWSIYLARRLNAANGEFMGLVLGAITLEHFERFFRSIALQHGGAIALARSDGMLLARYPRSDRIGKIIPAVARKSDAFTGKARYVQSPLDQQLRIVSARSLANFPLIVAVSQTEESALRGWHALSDQSTTMAFVKTFFVIFMAWVACRWWEQQRGLTHAIRAQNQLQKAIIDNFPGGISLIDRDLRVAVMNDRAKHILDLPESLFLNGPPTLEEVFRFNSARGEYGPGDAEEQVSTRMALARASQPHVFERQRPNGTVIEVRGVPIDGGGGFITTYTDISERRRSEARIAHMAHHDALTDLANRALLSQRLEQALRGVERGHSLAVHLIDLDHFKDVNDGLGHPVGDRLLKEAALRLQALAGDGDTVARMGGDEFAVLQLGIAQSSDAAPLAQEVIERLSAPYEIDGCPVVIGASVGIAIAPSDGLTAEDLLRNADLALYNAKGAGRAAYRFFQPETGAKMQERRALQSDLRAALADTRQIELHYQPMLDIDSGQKVAMEALVRWRHPVHGLIPPDRFVPLAEETGLIKRLGELVLRQACADAVKWPCSTKVCVNLSPLQFARGDLTEEIARILTETGLSPERLELEITESVLLNRKRENIAVLHALGDLGVTIALDDFGTGYSSLSYLLYFPLDKIKIDKSFVGELLQRDECAAIVCAIANLGRSLGMTVTAEGVETEEQLELIRAVGCTQAQGYLFGRPRPAADLDFDDYCARPAVNQDTELRHVMS